MKFGRTSYRWYCYHTVIVLYVSNNNDNYIARKVHMAVVKEYIWPRKLAYLLLLKHEIKLADAGIGYVTWTNKLLY